MAKKIHLSSPHMSLEGFEKQYVDHAFETNYIAPAGENIETFEQSIATYVGSEHVVALSSGTAAIHLALKDAGVSQGDIVLCQSLTFVASANPILYEGAVPVFIDSEASTWNMDPALLEEALKKYPQAKAVMVVHLYGISAQIDAIKALCEQYGVALIEDAAESLGTMYKGTHTGTVGDYGIFSFNGNKIITTSGGGALVSGDKEPIDKARFWATQAKDPARHYQHSDLGYNYRLSNVSAGIGRGQLRVLERRIEQKKAIFDYYKAHLQSLEGITFMPENDWDRPNYWLTCIVLEGSVKPLDIIEALEQENIEARPLWKPMHMQPLYKDYDAFGGKVSEHLFNNGVCLPSDTKMTTEDMDRIITIIKGLW